MSFISELNRRNVVRVGLAYLVGAWLVLQGAAPFAAVENKLTRLALSLVPRANFSSGGK